jgi:5'-methylthioadenosine phosphorylase
VEAIIGVLLGNAATARGVVAALAGQLAGDPHAATCGCRQALEHALITSPDARDPALVQRLGVIAGRMLPG